MKTLVLDGTTISIQVAMSTSAATTNPTFVASFADNSGSGITEGATDGALNGSTDVTVVAAPTGVNRRVIKDITIFNGDTAAVTVIIKYDNNATQRTLVKVTLAVGDTYTTDGTFDANGNLKQITTGGGDVIGPASATDNAITRFNLTTGKSIQNSLVTVADDGAITAPQVGSVIPFYYANQAAFPSAATYHGALAHSHADGAMFFAHSGSWVRIIDNGGPLGTPSSGTLSSCTVDGTNEVGFKNIPQNSQSAAYTLVLADAGKHIFHPSSDANARTYTIPANSSVAYPIGTAITFVNMTSQVVTIAITTDTMYLSSAGTTGSRSLAQYGSATAIKITSTNWLISGSGLT